MTDFPNTFDWVSEDNIVLRVVEVELPPNWNPEVDHAFVVLSPNGKTGFNFSFEEAVKFGKELVHLSDIMRHGGSSA
jgi:hypothetical protein